MAFEKIKTLINNTTDVIKSKKEELEEFDHFKQNAKSLDGLQAYKNFNTMKSMGREKIILSKCMNITSISAKLINELIPFNESIVNIKSSKEAKTMIDYLWVITNKYIYLINKNNYKMFYLNTFSDCKIISKVVMSFGVNIGGMAFQIEGNQAEVELFLNILNDEQVRNAEIKQSTEYLCGIEPVLMYYNEFLRGVSFSKSGDIVLHRENKNVLKHINNLQKIQLFFDSNVVSVKAPGHNPIFGNFQNDTHKMFLRFIFLDEEIDIDILPESLTYRLYKKEETIYIDSFEFGKSIMNKIAEIKKW